MSEALRRALTNALHFYDREAQRRRLSIIGGAEAIEAEAKLIRDNMAALSAVDDQKPPQLNLMDMPCLCVPGHCRGTPKAGEFCCQARAKI